MFIVPAFSIEIQLNLYFYKIKDFPHFLLISNYWNWFIHYILLTNNSSQKGIEKSSFDWFIWCKIFLKETFFNLYLFLVDLVFPIGIDINWKLDILPNIWIQWSKIKGKKPESAYTNQYIFVYIFYFYWSLPHSVHWTIRLLCERKKMCKVRISRYFLYNQH